MRAGLNQSEMKGNFRQDSLFLLHLLWVGVKKKSQGPSKTHEGHLVIRAPKSLCVPLGPRVGGWFWWTTQGQLILGHVLVVSAGTDSGQMPAQKCLEVWISALSKLSTAKMEKTISLRWEHRQPECGSPLGSVAASTLPWSSHAPTLTNPACCCSACPSVPTCIPRPWPTDVLGADSEPQPN